MFVAPIIEVNEDVLKLLSPNSYTRREDLERQITQVAELDRRNWVVIPREFSGREYQLIVDPARLSYNPAVERAGRELGLELKNTAEDSLGREFVGYLNWFESLKINTTLGNATLEMNDFDDYGKLLFLGMNGEINVYNVAGKQIDERNLRCYFEDIFKIKGPWRAEWIDADFKTKGTGLYINSNRIQISRPLSGNTLMVDRRISLTDFLLRNHTKQGLPTKNVKSGELHYEYPRSDNNSVVRFITNSGRTGLDCGRVPSYRFSNLGVRAVRHG